MASTTISKLKASLSELLMKVKAGEELFITDRGRTIAKIVPVKRDYSNIPAHLHALEKAGLLRFGKNRIPVDFWKIRRPKVKTSAINALLKNREEER